MLIADNKINKSSNIIFSFSEKKAEKVVNATFFDTVSCCGGGRLRGFFRKECGLKIIIF
jgi:hypothetical protein